jgi:uncharacterized protein with HEPN domain
MRRDRQFLSDILEAADSISSFLTDRSRETFTGDDLLRSAVLYKLTVIGEAAARLSPELRASHPKVPWTDIVSFRNIVVHAYFTVDWAIVWVAATEEVPELRRRVASILENEPPTAAG